MKLQLDDIIKYYHRLADARLSNRSGAVLLTVVVLIVVIGVTGVAIYSLTTTSTFSQLSSQNATQAFYLAESGFRVVASEYNQETGNKDAVIENLHNKTLGLPGNTGQFEVKLYPTWFYVSQDYSPGGSPDTIRVKIPGGVPLQDPLDPTSKIPIPDNCALKLQGKTQHATIISKSPSSPNDGDEISFTLSPGFPYEIPTDSELFLVYSDTFDPSTVSLNSDLTLNGSNAVAKILPAKNGSFRIDNYNNDKLDYTYKEAIFTAGSPPTITLTDIDHQNPADPSEFQFTVNTDTQLFVAKNLTVVSTASVGDGAMAGKKTAVNYTDAGVDGGFSTGKETISFAEDIEDFSPKMGTGGTPILEGAADAPITVDTTAKEVELGKNLTSRYGAIWYAGDTDIANCIEGRCNLGKGFRAYFEFQSDNVDTDADSEDYGDGFTFAVISGHEDSPGNYRNTADDTGSGGEYLGYAGPGLDDGLQPPKIGLEFDTYPNTKAGNICGSDSRRDDTPVANHTALVYWGETTPGSFDATGGYLSLGNSDWSSAQGTICFWFRRDTIYYGNGSSTGDRLWGQNANMEMRFSADGSDLALDWGGNNSLIASNPFSVANKWYFIAITWDEANDQLTIYWGDESTPPALLASETAWPDTVTTVAVNENLFMNSSGGNLGKNFQVDGQGTELRYYDVALDAVNLDEITSIYSSRTSTTNPQARFPLQADLVNTGFSSATATTVGSTGWSGDTPAHFACGTAAETYDDNRHGSGSETAANPMNSLKGNPTDDTDGYYPKAKESGDPNWLEDGLLHQARIELIRPLEPSIDGIPGGTDFEYQIKIWIDCPDCVGPEVDYFKDVKASFTAWAPLIQKTINSGNQLVLNQTLHDELKKILFGFTQGTGGATQNITLSNFKMYFLKRYPTGYPATW